MQIELQVSVIFLFKMRQMSSISNHAKLVDLVLSEPLCSDNLLMYGLKIAGLFELPIGYWYHQSELSTVNGSQHYQQVNLIFDGVNSYSKFA
ncbi:hypothetical protein BB562_10255 [Lactiplantibacillus pentosus]|nr:hypothetical protein BB562_10255 [Lactiplantibacillus pentosus]MCT3276767.1 hypothetical protein [Lactiplantibacillus pentosus]